MSCTVNVGDRLKDGRTVSIFKYNGKPITYDPSYYVVVIIDQEGKTICTTDGFALSDSTGCDAWESLPYCSDMYVEYQKSGITHDNPGTGESGNTSGILDKITSLISTLNDVFSGGLFSALKDAATALQTLPNTLASIISEITGSQNDILQQLSETAKEETAYLDAINTTIGTTLVNTVKDQTAQLVQSQDKIASAIEDSGKQVSEAIKTAQQMQIQAAKEEGDKTRKVMTETSDQITDAIRNAGSSVTGAVGLLNVSIPAAILAGNTELSGAIATLSAAVESAAGIVKLTQAGQWATVLKWVAIIGSALAIPAIADFDKLKGLFSEALIWLAEQQLDVSEKMYLKIRQKGLQV